MNDLEKVYRHSKLLKIKCIRDEVDELIKGFTVKDMMYSNETFTYYLENRKGEYLFLEVWGGPCEGIEIRKHIKNVEERVNIDKDLNMTHKIVEKRPKGVIYSIINKRFDKSKRFKDFVLVDLDERRMVFSKDNLERLLPSVDFDNCTVSALAYLLGFKLLECKLSGLENKCDYRSKFSTHMNHYVYYDGRHYIVDNVYPTKTFLETYLSKEDVSQVYDTVDGKDKLYRVYDLYSGRINPRNEGDIRTINLGLLTPDSFDLRTLKGITKIEDEIVGKFLNLEDKKYLKYLKNMINSNFEYKGDIELNRDSILDAIMYEERDFMDAQYDVLSDSFKEESTTMTEGSSRRLLRRIFKNKF